MNVTDKINQAATMDNALQWLNSPEKYLFCIDVLEISANDLDADDIVERLEEIYEALICDHIRSRPAPPHPDARIRKHLDDLEEYGYAGGKAMDRWMWAAAWALVGYYREGRESGFWNSPDEAWDWMIRATKESFAHYITKYKG